MRRRAKALANAARFRARGASLRRADGSQRSMQVMSVPAARHFTEQAGRSNPCRSCPCPQRVAPLHRRVGAIHAGLVHARGPLLRCTGGSERCRSCPCPQRVISPNRRVAAIHAGHVRARGASFHRTDGSERSMQVMSVPAARPSAAQARSKGASRTASDRPQSARRRAPPPRRFSSVRQVFRLWKRRRVHTKVAIFPGLPYNRCIILQTEEKAWKGFALTSTR